MARPKIDQIESRQFNRELKHLDLPDARWTHYRGPSGTDYAHPITMGQQAALLDKIGGESVRLRFNGRQRRGYRRAQFEEALRSGTAAPPRLRLVSE
jgi:hypothetical protein